MKLQFKLMLPIMITLVLCFVGMTVTSYMFSTKLIHENIQSITSAKVLEVEHELNNRLSEVDSLKSEMSKQYISKAKTVSFMVMHDTEMLNSLSDLQQLAKSLDVEEIHITDENGVIKWGTVPDFFDFDFSTTDQTKVFLPALTDKSFEMAQDPTERGSDKALFQYISVARLDAPGVVQIGVKPERLQQALEDADINKISQGINFGKTGYVFIIDKNSETIISHQSESEIGNKASEYGFYKDMKSKSEGVIQYEFEGLTRTLSYKTTGNYIVCSTINNNEFSAGLSNFLILNVIIAIIAILLSSVISYLLIRMYIVNEIKKVLTVLKAIGDGNLKNNVTVKSSHELKELSLGINKMLENLKSTMSQNIALTSALADVSDKLALAAEQSSRGAEEVAATVNELAVGAGEQAENSTQGAQLAHQALSQLESISRDISLAVENTYKASEAVEIGIQSMAVQSSSMDKNVSSVKTVNNTVNELAGKTAEIGNIIAVITGIAAQTNMLALNAAIEAARAGEAGKGFAVVADEVRKLAESATNSAQQISDIISEIQRKIENAKLQANESIITVAEQQKSMEHTKKSFEAISNSTDSTLTQINSIKSAADDMVKSVDNIVQVIETTAAAAEESAAGAEEISASTEEQSATMEEVSQIAKELKDMVVELNKLTSGFQI